MRIRKEADSLKIITKVTDFECDQNQVIEIIAEMILKEINSKNNTNKKTLSDDVQIRAAMIKQNYYRNSA
jgi:hypothetical protein